MCDIRPKQYASYCCVVSCCAVLGCVMLFWDGRGQSDGGLLHKPTRLCALGQ